jgi:hypothetical protein
MVNVQKYNICINVPSSQTLRCPLQFVSVFIGHLSILYIKLDFKVVCIKSSVNVLLDANFL